MNKQVYIAGVISATFYFLFLISTILLSPGYNHIRDSISVFSSTESQYKDIFDWLLTISGLALLVFAAGMTRIWQLAQNKNLEISGTLLMVYGMSYLPMKYFHMDQAGSDSTFVGWVYLFLVAVTTLTSILSVFYSAFGFEKARGEGLKIFSIISGAAIAFSSFISAVNFNTLQGYYGLFERLTIVTFFVWVFVISLDLFILQNHEKESLRT